MAGEGIRRGSTLPKRLDKDYVILGSGRGNQASSGSYDDQGSGRIKWSTELHDLFLDAVEQLGGLFVAKPRDILNHMPTSGLNINHVKSHLQKHRTNYKKRKDPPPQQHLPSKRQQTCDSGEDGNMHPITTINDKVTPDSGTYSPHISLPNNTEDTNRKVHLESSRHDEIKGNGEACTMDSKALDLLANSALDPQHATGMKKQGKQQQQQQQQQRTEEEGNQPSNNIPPPPPAAPSTNIDTTNIINVDASYNYNKAITEAGAVLVELLATNNPNNNNGGGGSSSTGGSEESTAMSKIANELLPQLQVALDAQMSYQLRLTREIESYIERERQIAVIVGTVHTLVGNQTIKEDNATTLTNGGV